MYNAGVCACATILGVGVGAVVYVVSVPSKSSHGAVSIVCDCFAV